MEGTAARGKAAEPSSAPATAELAATTNAAANAAAAAAATAAAASALAQSDAACLAPEQAAAESIARTDAPPEEKEASATTDDPTLSPFLVQYGLPVGLAALVGWLVYAKQQSSTSLGAMVGSLSLRVAAVAIGVALGLGWAMHVYEHLDLMQTKQAEQEADAALGVSRSSSSAVFFSSSSPKAAPLLRSRGMSSGGGGGASHATKPAAQSTPSGHLINSLEDEQTYASLMQAAGYYPVDKVLRGQVFKDGDAYWQTNYPFTHNIVSAASGDTTARPLRALQAMHALWPSLPEAVQLELAKFIEHIMRDYVSSWYSMIDATVSYTEERLRRQQLHSMSASSPRPRRMVYSMAAQRRAPFMEKLYETMTILFGNLATRVEHVNVLELALLKWTKILAHTFKTYRHLRRLWLLKHPHATEVSEMGVTKEFLFAGKLHKAVTFGLDVPALLFADAKGRECDIPGYEGPPRDEYAILEARLFGEAGVVAECELDYNRVVAYRMVRALLPRADFGSPLVSSLVTEIMAGCVLTPLMSCFCPAYLNSWIIAGLATDTTGEEATTLPSEEDKYLPAEQGVEVAAPESSPSGEISTLLSPPIPVDALMGNLTEPAAHNDSAMRSIPEFDASTKTMPLDESLSADVKSTLPLTHTRVPPHGEHDLVSQLAMVLIDLQDYMDLPEMRQAKSENRAGPEVDWDDEGCRAVVSRLVLLLEAALMDGRCTYRVRNESRMLLQEDEDTVDLDNSDRPVEVTLTQFESTTLSQLLMELTSDMEAFEERVATENTLAAESEHSEENGSKAKIYSDRLAETYTPTVMEQSTLRTLIAAWLHTGQVYRTVMVLMQAHATVLAPYYHNRAFLRSKLLSQEFLRVLRALEGIDVLVDTASIMNSPRLEEVTHHDEENFQDILRRPSALASHQRTPSVGAQSNDSFPMPNALSLGTTFMSTTATPRHVDFHRNESFAASLRSERERRAQSWYSLFENSTDEGLAVVCHTREATDEDLSLEDLSLFRELHHLARIFYSGTSLISVRDAARRNSTDDRGQSSSPASSITSSPVSLLTVEMASPRRRIEVPDDDSSFLLRAQPRPLNAVGVHRDQRNHDQSFKCFAGTYEEAALSTGSEHFAGGRYMRYCLIRYYPIDRTASIALHTDTRRVDQRRAKNAVPGTITLGSTSSPQTPFLSGEFLRERHLCQRWIPKGTTRTQSILASNVMEPTDFTSQPRTGKALDFVNRMTFFEKPMIELGGKIFTVHDSTSLGTHRADASSLEITDAALSATFLSIGEASASDNRHIEMGEDGYPIVWMKFSRKQDDAHIEVRPYRVSFVRAALLVTGARQEAQLQSLVACVKGGSAKKATKALTDERLKPALRLLEFAGNRSREKESLLLRDLKLGVNHIDREQLRRNGLLSPRYPTTIQELVVSVDDCLASEDVHDADLFGSSGWVYQIRVAAIVMLTADEDELEGTTGYKLDGRLAARTFREEWTVYRTFKEFQTVHRHLKSQVSTSESSGTAVSRLSATLNTGNATGRRHRSALIPSLSQASKIGALGLTKKSLQKRREYLDGYLTYLLAPDHLLNRCPELLLFVGAFYPLPPEAGIGHALAGVSDPLGRTQMIRTVVHQKEVLPKLQEVETSPPPPSRSSRAMSHGSINSGGGSDAEVDDETESPRRSKRQIKMLPAIRNKIDKVPLSQVRSRIFELLRYQFGFENASFVRNRMLAALKTASFAVTSASEFRRTLYNLHTEHLSGKAVAGWIKFGLDMLWPDGIFFESSPPLTIDELSAQKQNAKDVLHSSFPDALRAVLGQELTKDGVNVLHEMFQNRIVVKSLFYQLFDLLWLEVFPEIADVLQGGAALDVDM